MCGVYEASHHSLSLSFSLPLSGEAQDDRWGNGAEDEQVSDKQSKDAQWDTAHEPTITPQHLEVSFLNQALRFGWVHMPISINHVHVVKSVVLLNFEFYQHLQYFLA